MISGWMLIAFLENLTQSVVAHTTGGRFRQYLLNGDKIAL
jgi:hypothetical protein